MRSAREFSFELAVQDEDWLQNKLKQIGAVCRRTTQSFSLYLDTPDHAIAALGFGIGVRRRLAPGTSGKASTPLRERWTRFVEPFSPVPAPRELLEDRLRASDVREALALSTACTSEERLYGLRSGDAEIDVEIERSKMTVDGEVFAATVATFRHSAGNMQDFCALVQSIADPVKCRLSPEAAVVRAHRHARTEGCRHVGAFAPRLGRAMTMGEAFQTIAQACFDQFLLNEASVRDLHDPEAVHQCRVALRRLRAAMRLFQVRQDESWRADLKRLLALLRDARDLDVLLAEQIKPLLAQAPNPRLSGFLGEIELRRETAYDKLVAALQATQTKRFFLHLALWIEAGDFGDRHVWTENFLGFARQRLAKNTRKLLKRGDLVETHSDAERHETRIFAKNLRYSAEFLELLLSGKAARGRYEDLLDAVKQIQQIFGEYNDAIAARQFFAERADNPPAPDREDGAAVHGIQEPASPIDPEAEAAFLRKAKRAFRNLAETKPFWDKIPDPPDRRKPKFKSAEI